MSSTQSHEQNGDDAVTRLLTRPLEPEYVRDWAELLREARAEEGSEGEQVSLLVFRLGDELFGLRTDMIRALFQATPVHSVPHRPLPLLGIVNLDGHLGLCFSLHHVLQVPIVTAAGDAEDSDGRMVLLKAAWHGWSFPADEILGVYPFAVTAGAALPVTLSRSNRVHTCGIVELEGREVAVLDSDLLVEALERGVG
jgi:chemotaxis signal transduction protein